MRDRSGVKILPPNKNSLSTDVLDGSPVFRVTYSLFMYRYSFRLSSPASANCRPSRLPQHTQNTQLALQFSACRWNVWHCSTMPLWLFYYVFGRETTTLIMMSGLGHHRDVTHATQYYTSGLFTSVKPFQKLRIEQCTGNQSDLNIFLGVKYNIVILLLVVSVTNTGKNQPKKYQKYRSQYSRTNVSAIPILRKYPYQYRY